MARQSGGCCFVGLSFVLLSFVVRPAAGETSLEVWLTTADQQYKLARQPDGVFLPGPGNQAVKVRVDPDTRYQTIEGFGAHMTASSAWLLHYGLAAGPRDELLANLFSPQQGIGINYLRLPMGSSGRLQHWTYDDMPAGQQDPNLDHFSVAVDEEFIIPSLQAARQRNPELKVLATPWSPPAWMKSSQSLFGGSLLPQYYATYADYFVKFVRAYQQRGIPIHAVTAQNEPLHTTSGYASSRMEWWQQAEFLGDHLGPAFEREGIDAKILCWDHNWDNTEYALSVLTDPEAVHYVDGTAWHAYGGEPEAQSVVHDAFPDKETYFTEITGGDWSTNFGNNLVWQTEKIFIGATRNWAKTALLFHLALDENHGPLTSGGSRGVVTVNSISGEVEYNVEYYVLGHVSKFVDPGAFRIDSDYLDGQIETVAFLNPNGSEVLLALNPGTSARTFDVLSGEEHYAYVLPPRSVATFKWAAVPEPAAGSLLALGATALLAAGLVRRRTFSVLLVLCIVAQTGTARALPANLVGCWDFDGSLADQYGGNHGTWIGGGSAVYSYDTSPMLTGMALDLRVGNHAVRVANESRFDFAGDTGCTVAVWVKGFPGENWGAFVAKNGEPSGWQIRRRDRWNSVDWCVRGTFQSNYGGDMHVGDGDHWHHVVGVWDPATDTKAIYVDGQLDRVVTAAWGSPSQNNDPVVFGAKYRGDWSTPNYESFSRVMLDDIAIYAGALSANQIAALAEGADPRSLPGAAPHPIFSAANGHYYEMRTQYRTWSDARDDAERRSFAGQAGHLVTISDEFENGLVRRFTDARQISSSEGHIWLGLTDQYGTGQWQWIDTGQVVYENGQPAPGAFVNWDPGQPRGDGTWAEMWAAGTWNDERSWIAGPSLVEYDVVPAGTFDVLMVRSAGQPITNLDEAEALLQGQIEAAGEFRGTFAGINFLDPYYSAPRGHFPGDVPFPFDTDGDEQDFAVRATGTVSIPEPGLWTFGVYHDDHARLRVNGVLAIESPNSVTNDLVTLYFDEAGTADLELTFFEHEGYAIIELFAAQGAYTEFNPRFKLIGDVQYGGLTLIPEPSTMAMLAALLGSLCLAGFARLKLRSSSQPE